MSFERQLDLFDHVGGAFAQPESGRLTMQELYRISAGRAGISMQEMNARSPVGEKKTQRSLLQREVRWHCQSLKAQGLLERVEDARGVWQLTDAGKQKLRKARSGVSVLAFDTKLGIAIWGDAHRVFSSWHEPIFLCLTSPPYPLRRHRAYGGPGESEYTDFITRHIEPIVKNLVPGGNVVLSLSPDIFEEGSPSQSLYLERLTIALCDRLGLRLMNRVIWTSNKAPGPIQWASKERMQMNSGYEFLLWFCNEPRKCIADNRRELEPHTEKHKKFMAAGGVKKPRVSSDGAHRQVLGAYSNPTEGKIMRNVIYVSNTCASQRAYKKRARELGLEAHGAPMPLDLARKLIRFMTEAEQLVVDPFGGSMTTGLAAEKEGRRWASTELVYDYVRGAAERFTAHENIEVHLPLVA
ncbi:site-specific DNA-methyltransferase [Paraburkholderia fungorum]|uniref:site-specific DNA-methyltransferase n=1 Tax=Paraburkholderia fungorum TaxID=134537 RepID=UPI001620F359|nr:site-specific DNA-methyltransferase [Paraburkholderia fungorum]MBB5546554.1 site-specific DNA-methyltransferase (cytosine-N4-specific) [Paraburkholderia fungorum]